MAGVKSSARALGGKVKEGVAVFYILAVALAGALYVPGARIGAALRHRAARLLGERGGRFVDLASGTIRVVARGVLGVAAVQALIIGTGMMVAGVPAAGLLALAVLALVRGRRGPPRAQRQEATQQRERRRT